MIERSGFMTLRHMKIFVAVCRTGSITAAGKRLFLSQPSVSQAISELEQNYGVKLFDRISRRLHITEAGTQLLQYAEHIVQLFDEMEQGIKNWDSVGKLRIGASITVGSCYLPDIVKQLMRKYPELQISATVDNSDAIEKAVTENGLDVAVIEGAVHNPYLLQKPLLEDRLTFLCSVSHPLAGRQNVPVSRLQKEVFLLREKGSASRERFDELALANGLEAAPAWQSVSNHAILRAVQAGLGISILPYLLAEEYVQREEIALFTVQGITLQRKITAIWHKNKYLTQSARDFLALWNTAAYTPAAPGDPCRLPYEREKETVPNHSSAE